MVPIYELTPGEVAFLIKHFDKSDAPSRVDEAEALVVDSLRQKRVIGRAYIEEDPSGSGPRYYLTEGVGAPLMQELRTLSARGKQIAMVHYLRKELETSFFHSTLYNIHLNKASEIARDMLGSQAVALPWHTLSDRLKDMDEEALFKWVEEIALY